MTSFKLDTITPRALHKPVPVPRATPRTPSVVSVVRRAGLPIIMLLIVGGTPLWGGYATLVLALVAWRLAGVML